MKNSIFILILITILFSCKKPENRRCLKTVGNITEKEIFLESFDKLKLFEHIKYVLIQDSTNKIILKGGKNLLNEISISNKDATVEMRNNNRCNFLRNYKKVIEAEIHFTELMNIEIIGSETLTNKGTIQLNFFTLTISDGAGSVELNINANVFASRITGGNGDFTIKGNTNFAHFIVNGSGYCNTYDLNIKDSIAVITNSNATVKINADNTKFRAEIKRNGDLFYKGSPSILIYQSYGTGQLINEN